MGFELRREVRAVLPPGKLTPLERHLVLEIADQCSDKTREGFPGAELLALLIDKNVRTVEETLKGIGKKWVELRVELGKGADGRPYYSHRSKRTTFRLPKHAELQAAYEKATGIPWASSVSAGLPGAIRRKAPENTGASDQKPPTFSEEAPDFSGESPRESRGPSPQGSTPQNFNTSSLSGDLPPAPAPRDVGEEDRERDGSASPSTPDYQVLAEEGVDRDEAATLIPIIVELYEVRSPGFWRHVQRNRDIVGILARARAVAAGTVQPGQMVDAGREVQPYGAEVNRQPRTSERGRLSAGARKFTDAHRLADELDAEWAGVANRPDYEPEVTP